MKSFGSRLLELDEEIMEIILLQSILLQDGSLLPCGKYDILHFKEKGKDIWKLRGYEILLNEDEFEFVR